LAQGRRPLRGLRPGPLAVRLAGLAGLGGVLAGLGQQLLGGGGRLLDLLDRLAARLGADPLALGDRLGAQLLGLAAQPPGLLLELDGLGAVLLGVVLRGALQLLREVVRLGPQPVGLGLRLRTQLPAPAEWPRPWPCGRTEEGRAWRSS
ncbi:hypothetical protein ACFWD3_03585, partial [Micrococcus luteus]|uniref:hypothetical protein n=1 Tax=Micrococcus luteus TaxID=1270 RepID=UPI003665D2EB